MGKAEYALGVYCGVTFAGIKVAGLFRLEKEELESLRECMRRFHEKGFAFIVLKEDETRLLVYVYHEKKLKEVLFEVGARAFLRARGYEYTNEKEAIKELKKRMGRKEFPHEVGVFLGYPLEDVEGFIAHPQEGVLVAGCWKAYARAEEKKKTFERLHRCSENIRERLLRGQCLTTIFRVG